MTDSQPKQGESPHKQKSGKLGPFRQIFVEWEHRRLIYNLVPGIVVVAFVLMLEPGPDSEKTPTQSNLTTSKHGQKEICIQVRRAAKI